MNDLEEKRVQNLFESLQKDPESVLYANQSVTKQLLKKLSKSFYEKDKVFKKLYENLEDKNFDKKDYKVPLSTPFMKRKLTLIDQRCIVLRNHPKEFMLILLI